MSWVHPRVVSDRVGSGPVSVSLSVVQLHELQNSTRPFHFNGGGLSRERRDATQSRFAAVNSASRGGFQLSDSWATGTAAAGVRQPTDRSLSSAAAGSAESENSASGATTRRTAPRSLNCPGGSSNPRHGHYRVRAHNGPREAAKRLAEFGLR